MDGSRLRLATDDLSFVMERQTGERTEVQRLGDLSARIDVICATNAGLVVVWFYDGSKRKLVVSSDSGKTWPQ